MFVFEIYMNIPRPPRCLAAGTWPPGRGLSTKKIDKKLHQSPWRTGRPAAERRALAARLRGDRPPQPYIRCWLPRPPSFGSLKIQKKRKKRERGRERRGE